MEVVINHDYDAAKANDDDGDDDDDVDDDDDDLLSAGLLDMQGMASEVSSPPGFSSLQQKLYELTIHRDEGEQIIEET